MTMRSGGGYVLWGTRVFPDESVIAVGKGMKRRREESVESGVSLTSANVAEDTPENFPASETEVAETREDDVEITNDAQ